MLEESDVQLTELRIEMYQLNWKGGLFYEFYE